MRAIPRKSRRVRDAQQPTNPRCEELHLRHEIEYSSQQVHALRTPFGRESIETRVAKSCARETMHRTDGGGGGLPVTQDYFPRIRTSMNPGGSHLIETDLQVMLPTYSSSHRVRVGASGVLFDMPVWSGKSFHCGILGDHRAFLILRASWSRRLKIYGASRQPRQKLRLSRRDLGALFSEVPRYPEPIKIAHLQSEEGFAEHLDRLGRGYNERVALLAAQRLPARLGKSR